MKCVKNSTSGNVSRTTNKHAAHLVRAWDEWSYASKKEWKDGGRLRTGPQQEPSKIGSKSGAHRR